MPTSLLKIPDTLLNRLNEAYLFTSKHILWEIKAQVLGLRLKSFHTNEELSSGRTKLKFRALLSEHLPAFSFTTFRNDQL